MREEQMIDFGGIDSGLEQTSTATWAAVEQQPLVATLHQITGAGTMHHRRRGARSQQQEFCHVEKGSLPQLYRHRWLA